MPFFFLKLFELPKVVSLGQPSYNLFQNSNKTQIWKKKKKKKKKPL